MVVFALFLGTLIFIHELGHYLFAKLLNVKVLKFSIGFGPPIVAFRRGETEYVVSWIPLGGFVKMAGDQPYEELTPEEAKRGFLAQPPWKRGLIVGAGPAFNLIFPVLIYFAVNLGPTQAISTRVGTVEPGMAAAAAGIESGDRILAVDGKRVGTFGELRSALEHLYDKQIPVLIDRNGVEKTLQLSPTRTVEAGPLEKVSQGRIGILPAVMPAVVGVPSGSAAEAAGLRTFDRILSIDGRDASDEVKLKEALASALTEGSGPLEVKVLRPNVQAQAGFALQLPSVHTVSLPRLEAPDAYGKLGGAERADLYVANVRGGSPAEAAGLKEGDRLLSINGKQLKSWLGVRDALATLDEQEFALAWRSREGTPREARLKQAKVSFRDEFNQKDEALDLGVTTRAVFAGERDPLFQPSRPEIITLHIGPGQALSQALTIVPKITRDTALAIVRLITGRVSMDKVGGPGTLWTIVTPSVERGVDYFLSVMAIVSINLGLMNLLPIPILDGFHLLAAFWEGIRRRPIPIRAREIANVIGLVLLAMIFLRVLYNDFSNLTAMGGDPRP